MHGILLPWFDFQDGNVREAGLTYEEVNDRLFPDVLGGKAPTPPRQSDLAPRKPAQMQAAFFYQPVSQDGAVRPYNVGIHNKGYHTVIAPGGTGSWTSSPRGILKAFANRYSLARRDPASYGDEVPEY